MLGKRFGRLLLIAIVSILWNGIGLISLAQKGTASLKKEKSQLESKKKYLAREISNASKELNSTTTKQKKTLQYIDQLSTKIQFREELVETFREEVRSIEQEMEIQKRQKAELEKLEKELKEAYGRMVYFAYKNRNSDDQVLYILASENMNQAFARARFFNQLAGFRRVQLSQLNETRNYLNQVINKLDSNRVSKSAVLKAEEAEKQVLEVEKQDQTKLAQQLRGKEAELRKKIKKSELERQQLEKKIQDIVRKLIEEERKKAEAAAKKKAEEEARKAAAAAKSGGTAAPTPKPVAKTDMVTPATKLKSASFEGNKGNMSWPVERGAITGKYGVQPHPYLKGVTIKNDGVDITAPAGSSARAIFEGEVSGVFAVDGYGKVVILKHGEYYTVYSNLDQVSVSKGAQLSRNQKIGSIMSSENGKAVMNFQIRKGSNTQNPSSWLAY